MLQYPEPQRPFEEPWQAQVFGLTHALAAAGHFTWPEWAAHFGKAFDCAQKAGGPVDGSDYYDVWLGALEAFLVERGHADLERLNELRTAWTEAYLTTPHGAPVKLSS